MKMFKFIMCIWTKYKRPSNPFSEAIDKGIAEGMKGMGITGYKRSQKDSNFLQRTQIVSHFMQSKQQVDFIDIVIDLLVEKFLKPLNQLSREKNYFVYVASLAEIVDWAQDFWNQYFDLPGDWETFRSSKRNIFKAESINDFIIAFGQEKFKTFCIENADYPEYFLEKYSELELNTGEAESC